MNVESSGDFERILGGERKLSKEELELCDIESSAAKKIRELILSYINLNYTKISFGDNFPKTLYYTKHGDNIVPIAAEGIFITTISDAHFVSSKAPEYIRYKLVLLPDGLYIFGYDESNDRVIFNSETPAEASCYLYYGKMVLADLQRFKRVNKQAALTQ